MLLCDPSTTPLAPLVQRTLLAPGAASAAFVANAGLHGLTLAQALRR